MKFDFFLIQEEEMAFGLAVADYDIQTGTYGKTIKVNISTYIPRTVNYLQGEDDSGIKSDPVESEVSLAVLQSYLEDSECPDLAFNYANETLTIFFKNDEYDTRFAFGGTRKPQSVSSSEDLLDIPDEHLDLVSVYARKIAWLLKKRMVDRDIQNKINDLEFAIRS